MGTLANIKNAVFNLFQGAPGKSLNVEYPAFCREILVIVHP